MALAALAPALGGSGISRKVEAQVQSANQTPRVGCFRGGPLPRCRSFWIFEIQLESPRWQTTRATTWSPSAGGPEVRSSQTFFDTELDWSLGHMVNVGSRSSLGLALSAGSGGGPALSRVKLRGRRWLNEDLSIEVEGGLIRREFLAPEPDRSARGYTLATRLNLADYVSFYVRWEGVNVPSWRYSSPEGDLVDPGGFQQAISVGAGLGNVMALIGTGVVGLLVIVGCAAGNCGE